MIGVLDHREHLIVRLVAWEGMRPGEILGLQIGDLDLGGDCLRVRRRGYKTNVDVPKTDRSVRQVALLLGTIALLELWVAGGSRFLAFPNRSGQPPARTGQHLDQEDASEAEEDRDGVGDLPGDAAFFRDQSEGGRCRCAHAVGSDGDTIDVNENEYAVSDSPTRSPRSGSWNPA